MVSLWKQINKSAKGGAGTTSYNYSFMRSYTSSKQTWHCCLHRSASVYASIINNAWATEATQRQLSSHYFIAASVCVHRVRDGTNSIKLPTVRVRLWNDKQTTNRLHRSIDLCVQLELQPQNAYGLPSAGRRWPMHAFHTLEGHARRCVAAPSSYPRLKPCAHTRRLVFATAPAMHTDLPDGLHGALPAPRPATDRRTETPLHTARGLKAPCYYPATLTCMNMLAVVLAAKAGAVLLTAYKTSLQ